MQDEAPPINVPIDIPIGGQTPYGGFPGYAGPSGDIITSLDQLYITSSRAIFVGQANEKAPVAVAGALIKMSTFRENFFNSTLKCGSKKCSVKCDDETTHCLVVDNNGFIIISEDIQYTGKFLSEFDDILLESLISSQIFTRKRIIDYQAICIESYAVSGIGSRLLAPFKYIIHTFVTVWMRLIVLIMDTFITGSFSEAAILDEASTLNPPMTGESGGGAGVATGHGHHNGEIYRRVIKKTRPKPCIQEMNLLQGSPKFFSKFSETPRLVKSKCNSCTQTAIVQLVPYTNLLTIALINACNCASPSASAHVSRKRYTNGNNNEGILDNETNNEVDEEDGEQGKDDNEDEEDSFNYGRYKKLEPRTIATAGECSVLPSFYRQRPKGECISSHPEEANIKLCGLALTNLLPSSLPIIMSIITTVISFLILLT